MGLADLAELPILDHALGALPASGALLRGVVKLSPGLGLPKRQETYSGDETVLPVFAIYSITGEGFNQQTQHNHRYCTLFMPMPRVGGSYTGLYLSSSDIIPMLHAFTF